MTATVVTGVAVVITWAVALNVGRHMGHKRGWYRGYDARKYESYDGENYR